MKHFILQYGLFSGVLRLKLVSTAFATFEGFFALLLQHCYQYCSTDFVLEMVAWYTHNYRTSGADTDYGIPLLDRKTRHFYVKQKVSPQSSSMFAPLGVKVFFLNGSRIHWIHWFLLSYLLEQQQEREAFLINCKSLDLSVFKKNNWYGYLKCYLKSNTLSYIYDKKTRASSNKYSI